MKPVDQILSQLDEIFSELNKKYIQENKRWIMERKEAVDKFKSVNKARNYQGGSSVFYSDLYTIAGGKWWYEIIYGNSNERILELVEKYCNHTIKAREFKITKRLLDLDIIEISKSDIKTTSDGFNGQFYVNTPNGTKCIHINTILAGGYNIQCLHQRVLIKVK